MSKSSIELLFDWLDKTTSDVQNHQDEPYLDSLAVTLESLFENRPSELMDDLLSHKVTQRLKEVDIHKFTVEEIRKAIQLVVLKGMQRTTQQQHQMTPEAVSLFVGFLANKLMRNKQNIRVFDPVCGTANLLTTIVSQLEHVTDILGSEVDPTLIKIALYNANLQQLNIELFQQDSLRPLLVDPVDLIVADLPVGYYPDDVIANKYELKANKGNSYAHHLLIEQSLRYTKPGGYLIFLIPEFLFASDQSEQLNEFLASHTHITGVLRLPESSFASKQRVKSILILQKKGEHTVGTEQPLLVNLPSFNNAAGMKDILAKIDAWFTNYFDHIDQA